VTPFSPPLSSTEIEGVFPNRFMRLVALTSGGQGAVFRGTLAGGGATSATPDVALKIYYADQVEERTTREIAALQRLQADVLVRLLGTGHVQIRGEPCIWMETEFIEGRSLASCIATGPLGIPQVSRLVHDVALAIEVIWADRIVHRDIKPDNIMVRSDGRAVLIDLGVARHTALSSLTTYGKTWGTEGYLSPEQAQTRRALTCKSDIFALGIVAQEALLGRHPTNRRQALLATGGPSTNALRPGIPPTVAATIDLMVSRDSFARPLPKAVVAAMQPFLT
jgi:eukaryotic-like serine/threonine-protein kinase